MSLYRRISVLTLHIQYPSNTTLDLQNKRLFQMNNTLILIYQQFFKLFIRITKYEVIRLLYWLFILNNYRQILLYKKMETMHMSQVLQQKNSKHFEKIFFKRCALVYEYLVHQMTIPAMRIVEIRSIKSLLYPVYTFCHCINQIRTFLGCLDYLFYGLVRSRVSD